MDKTMAAVHMHSQGISALTAAMSLLILMSCRQPVATKIDASYSVRIESAALNETRDIFIHLPDGYERSEKKYPVLYVLDAEDVFAFAVGAADFLADSRVPEMIVVGIPNTHRERDIWVDLEDPLGGHVNFIAFLEKELIPYVETRCRTQPFRVFYGFCSGASTSFWILFNKPEMFEGYIASGTGFDEAWADLGRQAFEKHPAQKKSLFAVTEGTTPRAEGMPLLRRLLETSAPPDLRWDCQVMEGEEHGPVLARGLFAGLRFVFRDWPLPVEVAARGPGAIKAYYQELSRDYGFDTGIPEQAVLSAASSLFWQGLRKEATEVFQFVAAENPRSLEAFELLGLAYEEDKEFGRAKEAYESAVRNAKENADRRLPTYLDALKNVSERIRGGR